MVTRTKTYEPNMWEGDETTMFGATLRAIRRSYGLRLTDVCTTISRQRASDYETGRHIPSKAKLKQLLTDMQHNGVSQADIHRILDAWTITIRNSSEKLYDRVMR